LSTTSLTESGRIAAPPRWLFLLESRALVELGFMLGSMPWLKKAPRGDGHPVLVLPGFLASSASTIPLRSYLRDLGYDAHRWRLGRNTGYSPELFEKLTRRVRNLSIHAEQSVSLVGWSLGGVFAREVARIIPDRVRQVITLGSPFRGGNQGTNVSWLYQKVSGHSLEDFDQAFMQALAESPPVPCTAIHTHSDGVVNWETTIEDSIRPDVENVEVGGAHCGLGFNPKSLWVIADRLAQNDGEWRPFRPKGLLSWIY